MKNAIQNIDTINCGNCDVLLSITGGSNTPKVEGVPGKRRTSYKCTRCGLEIYLTSYRLTEET